MHHPEYVYTAPLTGLDSVRVIRDYFLQRRIELSDFEPDHMLVSDLDGASETRSPKLMRRGRDEFLVYHPNAAADRQQATADPQRTARLRLDLREAPGAFAVEWYRALDGTTHGGAAEGGTWLNSPPLGRLRCGRQAEEDLSSIGDPWHAEQAHAAVDFPAARKCRVLHCGAGRYDVVDAAAAATAASLALVDRKRWRRVDEDERR